MGLRWDSRELKRWALSSAGARHIMKGNSQSSILAGSHGNSYVHRPQPFSSTLNPGGWKGNYCTGQSGQPCVDQRGHGPVQRFWVWGLG